MAFGDLKGTLSVSNTSNSGSFSLTGSVSINTGDLIVVNVSAVSGTSTPITVNGGYTTLQDANDGNLRCKTAYRISTVTGTLSSISVSYSGSGSDDYAATAAVFEGPFTASPLDANPSPTVDRVSPYGATPSGTLAQANELIIAFLAIFTGRTDVTADPALLLAINTASSTDDAAGSVSSSVGYKVVSSTSSTAGTFISGGSGRSNGLAGLASFMAASTDRNGVLSETLDAVTTSAAGTVIVSALLGETLGGATLSATGALPIAGSVDASLTNASLAASGGALVNAEVDATLGDVTIFAVAIEFENLAVWPFFPDWQNDVTETLSWLTQILASRTGAEQRFGLRLAPRRAFEATFKLVGRFRTLFDLFVMRVGGSAFYIPVWHDSNKLIVAATAGETSIEIGDTEFTEFQDSPGVFIRGADPLHYEIAEYNGQTDTQILLANALVSSWPKGTRVFPIQKVEFDAQPQAAGKADRAYETRVKFRSVGGHNTAFETDIPLIGDKFVLNVEPNYVQDLTYNYDRILADLDNQTGAQLRKDINHHGSTTQQYTFFLKGRERHAWFRAFVYALKGRQIPIYTPTFMEDLELVSSAAGPSMIVKRCGYTELSGVFPGRDRILILLHDGTRMYRRIIESSLIDDDTESLSVIPLLFVLKESVHRISFLPLGRLDQDDIEIVHHTDTHGLSTITTVLKSIPDTLSSAAIREAVVDVTLGLAVTATGTAEATLFYFEFTYLGYDNDSAFPGSKLSGACFGIASSLFDMNGATNGIYMASPSTSNEQESLFVFGQASGTGSRGYPDAITLGAGIGTSGDTFGMAIDIQNKLLWVRDTSSPSTWYGSSSGGGSPDPETGNRGFDYSANLTNGPVFLLGGSYKDQSATGAPYGSVLLNTGASSFGASPPSGYVSWDSTGATEWDSGYQTISDANLRVTGNNTDPTYNWHPFFCRSNTSKG